MAASSMEIYSWLQVSHEKNKGKRISVFKEDDEEDDNGFIQMNTSTLDLLGCLTSSASSFSSTSSSSSSSSAIELDSGTPPPSGWEKCLDLKVKILLFNSQGTDHRPLTA